MKKFLTKILSLAGAALCCLSASAADFEVDGISYNIVSGTEKTVSITSSPNCSGDVVIEETVSYGGHNFTVESVENSAFAGCNNLTSIVLPSTITILGESAFQKCKNLNSVDLGNGITDIPKNAFSECASLSSVKLGNSVKTIGNYSFQYCTSLESINFPTALQSIGGYAFTNCSSLKSIDIPDNVNNLGEESFRACSQLKSVVLGNSIVRVPFNGFASCTSLTDVVFGSSISIIAWNAFVNCTSLKQIYLPNTISLISETSFYNTGLTYIVIPSSVTSFNNGVFQNCADLTSVEIPASISKLTENIFSGCTNLTELICHNPTPPTVEQNAFNNVSKLNCTIKVPGESLNAYKSAEGWDVFFNFEAIDGSAAPAEVNVSLADGEEYTSKSWLETDNLTYTRSFSNTNWQPLYVPFSMDFDEWDEWAEVAEINDVHQFFGADEATVIEFRRLTGGSTKANTPYVIRAKAVGDVEKTFTGKRLLAARNGSVDCSSAHWLYTLTGVYADYYGMNGKYALASDGSFTRGTSDTQKLNPQRFYLEVTPRDGGYGTAGASNAPKRIGIAVDGEATGIECLPAAGAGGEARNLQGMKVGGEYKGIVIVNGKKLLKR